MLFSKSDLIDLHQTYIKVEPVAKKKVRGGSGDSSKNKKKAQKINPSVFEQYVLQESQHQITEVRTDMNESEKTAKFDQIIEGTYVIPEKIPQKFKRFQMEVSI